MKENHASLLIIEQSHSSFDCLQWREIILIFVRLTSTCRGGVFRLNSKEITVNLLAVISVHGNEKFSGSLFLNQDFLFYHHRRRNMLFAQTFMQSRKANRQSKVGVLNL